MRTLTVDHQCPCPLECLHLPFRNDPILVLNHEYALYILYSVLERQKPPSDTYNTIVGPPIINRTSSVSAPLGITRPSSSSSPSVIKTESPSFDDVADHLFETSPKDGAKDVPLGSKIIVLFDKDVRSVNVPKLFEVRFPNLTNSYYLYRLFVSPRSKGLRQLKVA